MSYWEAEIKDRARAMRLEGRTLRAIAEALDSNRQTIGTLCWDIPHRNNRRDKVGPLVPHTLKHHTCWQCAAALPSVGLWGGRFCHQCYYDRRDRSGRAKAGRLVAKAIRSGDLAHPRTLQCADCPRQAEEYDHRDYNKPLDVQPVCRKCNARRGPGIWVQFKPVRELIAERLAA